MSRPGRRKRRLVIPIVSLTVGGIILLEIGSRYYHCPATAQLPEPTVVCDAGYYPASQGKLQTIQAIIESKGQGMEPSRADLEKAANFVKYEDMPGLNGVACGNGLIFVRDNLGNEGRYFVARHELQHLFARNGVDQQCSQKEYCATITAARMYPVGFVETVLSSLYISASESPTVWCFLFGSWSVFRTYLLPQ